jgi:hypothetical protein
MASPAGSWQGRLQRVQHMTDEAHHAALAGDWETAIRQMDAAFSEAERSLKDLVNLARTVGGLSDAQVGTIRGTSASAVTQRFGARSRLLQQAMTAEWEAAQQEWRDHGGDI